MRSHANRTADPATPVLAARTCGNGDSMSAERMQRGRTLQGKCCRAGTRQALADFGQVLTGACHALSIDENPLCRQSAFFLIPSRRIAAVFRSPRQCGDLPVKQNSRPAKLCNSYPVAWWHSGFTSTGFAASPDTR
jgi:hypothetical protein